MESSSKRLELSFLREKSAEAATRDGGSTRVRRGLVCGGSTFLNQSGGSLAELLKRDFQRTKFLRAQFR